VNNGATYKTTRPDSPCDKDNNVLLMQSVRNKLEALKSDDNPVKEYVLSLAVPANQGDMLAYDKAAATEIDKVVDFWVSQASIDSFPGASPDLYRT
jgi:GH18 family chitinase